MKPPTEMVIILSKSTDGMMLKSKTKYCTEENKIDDDDEDDGGEYDDDDGVVMTATMESRLSSLVPLLALFFHKSPYTSNLALAVRPPTSL